MGQHEFISSLGKSESCKYISGSINTPNSSLIYNENLNQIGSVELPAGIHEGWGITHRKRESSGEIELLITDGTANVYVVEPNTWKIKKTVVIKDSKRRPIDGLNELEYIEGKLFANRFLTTSILVINLDEGIIEQFVFICLYLW